MFVVDSNKWHASLAPGQERLLVELWLEALAPDTSVLYWPAICSSLQTLRNLLAVLQDVERQILRDYHVRESAEETAQSLIDCNWLNVNYGDDLSVLRDLLTRLLESHGNENKGKKQKKTEKSGNEEDRNRKVNQDASRRTTTSFLKAFLAKVDRGNPIELQVILISRLAADTTTQFKVLSRTVGELVNDLVHLGHSRDHLYGWMFGAVFKSMNPKPVLDRFVSARNLGQKLAGGCEVLFMVSDRVNVPDSEGIRFVKDVPSTFRLLRNSPFLNTAKQFALVAVPNALDGRVAREQADKHLTRYLHSTRLDHIDFDRTVDERAAVRVVANENTQEFPKARRFSPPKLFNDDKFYAIPAAGRNNGTFAELDRLLYWLEQSGRSDDVGRLIALWTAMEFMFSKTTRSAAESIKDFLPAYLVPNFARELLVDLWAFIEHVPDITIPQFLMDRLEVQETGVGNRRKVNLVKLLELCLEPEATNPLKALIQEYPIILRKFGRVRQLDPTPQNDMPIFRDISRFEREVEFDLRYAYRARNSIVHDAAIQIVQIDRLIQRLNWMLCTALDSLLYQFVHNPTLSLSELHEINKHNFVAWKKRLKGGTMAMPLSEIVDPPRHCLAVK